MSTKSGEVHYLIYIDSKTKIENYPNVLNYLQEHKNKLSKRNEVKNKLYEWYRLERPRTKEIFDAEEKIIVPYRATSNRFAYDDEQFFNDGGDIRAIVITDQSISIKYVVGVLNSKLIDWFYGFIGKPKGNSREYFNEPLAKIPIPSFASLDQEGVSLYNKIIQNVDQILVLSKSRKVNELESKAKAICSQIEYCEGQINELVFQLYGLSKEEIETVLKPLE